jgi:hypothetical protein
MHHQCIAEVRWRVAATVFANPSPEYRVNTTHLRVTPPADQPMGAPVLAAASCALTSLGLRGCKSNLFAAIDTVHPPLQIDRSRLVSGAKTLNETRVWSWARAPVQGTARALLAVLGRRAGGLVTNRTLRPGCRCTPETQLPVPHTLPPAQLSRRPLSFQHRHQPLPPHPLRGAQLRVSH